MLNEVIKIEPFSSMTEVLKRRGRDTRHRRPEERLHKDTSKWLQARCPEERHLPNLLHDYLDLRSLLSRMVRKVISVVFIMLLKPQRTIKGTKANLLDCSQHWRQQASTKALVTGQGFPPFENKTYLAYNCKYLGAEAGQYSEKYLLHF